MSTCASSLPWRLVISDQANNADKWLLFCYKTGVHIRDLPNRFELLWKSHHWRWLSCRVGLHLWGFNVTVEVAEKKYVSNIDRDSNELLDRVYYVVHFRVVSLLPSVKWVKSGE